MKEWFSYQDLSERWGIAVQTLRVWVMEGKLKAVKFGRLVRFHISYILEVESRGIR